LGRTRTFWRLFGSFALLVLVSNGLVGFVVVQQVEENEKRLIEETLLAKTLVVEEEVLRSPEGPVDWQARMNRLHKKLQTPITLIAADGRALADTSQDPAVMENHGQRREILEAAAKGTGTQSHFSDTLGHPMMYVARRVEAPSPVAFVRVAR